MERRGLVCTHGDRVGALAQLGGGAAERVVCERVYAYARLMRRRERGGGEGGWQGGVAGARGGGRGGRTERTLATL